MDQKGVTIGKNILNIKSQSRKNLWKKIKKFKALYIMLLPGLIWFIIFRYLPMYGVTIAFKQYNIMKGIMGSSWANPWYKYFYQFFQSPYFVQLLRNTTLISLYKLFFGMVPPIMLAILLNECRISWYRRWVQTLTYMPHFLSWVIIYGIVLIFLSQDSGILNRWLVEMGGKSLPFLTSTDWFRSIIVGSQLWKDVGWGAIIYLAAMSGIDPNLYEAAKIDGASRLRSIWHITLPGIRNVIVMLLILRLGRMMNAGFQQIFVMYNVHVYEVVDILDTWVYRTGLEQMNFSLATAVGLFKSFIGMFLVLVSNKIARRWDEGIW